MKFTITMTNAVQNPPGNRKGQIPILMLFVVTLVLVITSLVLFVSFEKTSGRDGTSSKVSEVIKNATKNQILVLDLAKGAASSTLVKNFGSVSKGGFSEEVGFRESELDENKRALYGNFFAKIRDEEFEFSRVDEFEPTVKLEIKGLFVQADTGNNYIKKDFDLCMLFDSDGKYLLQLSSIRSVKLYSEHCKEVVE